jgi:alkylation response protein AidB-like acyl-CoA dehydrogenase
MNFELTEDRRMLADTLNRFVREKYPFPTRDKIAKSPEGFSREIWRELAELGVIGALFSEADGGFGGAGFDIAVVFESLGRGLVVEPFLPAVLAGSAIAHAGSAPQKQWIERIIAGEAIVAWAHDEAGAHYTLSHVETKAGSESALKAGSESALTPGSDWTLTGTKSVVQNAEAADAFIVSARLSGDVDDESGIALFIVPAGTAGVTVRGYPTIDGGRAAEVTLQNVKLPAAAMLGAAGSGYATLEKAIGAGIVALCAEALGAMDEAKNATLEYLRTRKQFGVPIGSFQALQHRMANLLLEIEQARSAVINAAAALPAERIVRERALSAAKYSIGRIGTLVAEESIQMHGGIGMTDEHDIGFFLKRARVSEMTFGDAAYHRDRFAALGGY